MDTSAENREARARLREFKERWGIRWMDMARVLGYAERTLTVYASRAGEYMEMPLDLRQRIMALTDADSPDLDSWHVVAIVVRRGEVKPIPLPHLSWCEVCGGPFVPQGYGQKYCSHPCRLASRRQKRKQRKEG